MLSKSVILHRKKIKNTLTEPHHHDVNGFEHNMLERAVLVKVFEFEETEDDAEGTDGTEGGSQVKYLMNPLLINVSDC